MLNLVKYCHIVEDRHVNDVTQSYNIHFSDAVQQQYLEQISHERDHEDVKHIRRADIAQYIVIYPMLTFLFSQLLVNNINVSPYNRISFTATALFCYALVTRKNISRIVTDRYYRY